MMPVESFVPRQYPGVMVSSTFRDLERHRAALIKAIEAHGMHAVAMEQDAALPDVTVIDSSLRKVRDAAAYIGLISHRYGQVPDSMDSNPEGLSLTELEFREARRLERPILIFIMGTDHDVKLGAVERDPEKIRKLEAFREEVKRSTAESRVQRVYKEFNSLREFEIAAMQSVAELGRFLDASFRPASSEASPASGKSGGADTEDIPRPPMLYAEPRYIGSHAFVGRVAELETLSDWASPSEPHPVLLYEAIGGTGKSMLTWEWTINHASAARTDWAGHFWYSFYEKGADMADFCRRALAYMTGQPLAALSKQKQSELSGRLLLQLQARPWLLVLDGLERILVAYHRYDAAQVADEHAGRTDEIGHRDPSNAIRPRDNDLLRSLTGAAPSKILITSRLMPRVLLNPAGQPIPSVLHQRLAGLRPADAEALLRACGIRGDSQLIRTYLQQHCDCHPLVTGIVAGLVSDYLADRGHFDTWAADPGHGGRLNLAELDLVQKRNHILKAAVDALPDKSRQFLSTLALLSEAVDYDTLTALNPYLPPQAQPPPEPERPEDKWDWDTLTPDEQREAEKEYTTDRERHARDERAHRAWLESGGPQEAARQLALTVRDLERRGLLQYDRQADRYDLHPVVRGFASGGLRSEDRDRLGQRAVDYFSQRPQDPYEQAETLDDVRNSLRLVRTLLQMGRTQDAFDLYRGDLSTALFNNLEAYAEILSLLRPFFGKDWASPTADLDHLGTSYLVTDAACSLASIGQLEQSLSAHEAALEMDLRHNNWNYAFTDVSHIAGIYSRQYHLARCEKTTLLGLEIAELVYNKECLFLARLDRFNQLYQIGCWADAEAMWRVLDPMGRDWLRISYRPGDAEALYAESRFTQGCLSEELLAHAEDLARSGRNRKMIRFLHALRGRWQLGRAEWALAAENLHEAIRMTHEAGTSDTALEAYLALAQFQLGRLPEARQEAIRLSSEPNPAHLALAELWQAIGDPEQAAEHALVAYRWAWADGTPYVNSYELACATALLTQLGAEIPELPAYDPAKDQPLPLEDQIRIVIQKRRSGKR